jgi:hypothetical protein
MRSEATIAQTSRHLFSTDWFRVSSRCILVRVLDGGREVDSFQASDPEILWASLRPILRHMRSFGLTLEFTGVEERWLPARIRASRQETTLANAEEAVEFLAHGARMPQHGQGYRGAA